MNSEVDIEILILTKKYLNEAVKLVQSTFTDEEKSVKQKIDLLEFSQ